MKKSITLGNRTTFVLITPPEAGYTHLKQPLVEVELYGTAVASFYPEKSQLIALIAGLQAMLQEVPA